MKTALDNITLIQKFLKGDDTLLANRELRIEKALDETQLLTTQGILLAKGRFKEHLPNVVVRLKSDYWEVINQLALSASFIPFSISQARLAKAKFTQYDYHSLPTGYQVHCQDAAAFWKTWWINHRRLQLMDMLLLCNKRWCPINQMVCDTGTIYVKTWRGEQALSLAETVVWIDRNTQEQRRRAMPRKHHDPGRSGVSGESPVRSKDKQPLVPAELQQVIKADENRLLVHTVLGPVVIEGENLTCTLARKVARAT